MAKRRGGLGARLARLMARLGTWREQKGKETSEDAGAQDRPWGGQSCPDLAQGSTSNLSLKAQTQSRSEWDLRAGSHGSWLWKRWHISEEPSQVLGRLQRPAVGSASDLAIHASLEPNALALAVASAESTCTQSPSRPMPAPDLLEQESLGCTCLQTPSTEVPSRPEAPSNVEAVLLLPRPASFPRAEAEGTKGEQVTLGPALSEPAQTLHARAFTKRTRYHITVTLQECKQAPREEGEEPEPAQPDPHPCGPEESMGWREPPQGPRPISGCPTNPPQDSRLKAGLHQRSTVQRQELLTGWTPESSHRRELAHSETRTPQDRLLGPSMEEAGGPQARAEARVVSATLMWRQRPPAQEESRHRFHKMSLVSGSQMEAPREEMLEYSHQREEVNGFTTREEETMTYQGPRDGAGVKSFQSHGPIFSKKYTPPPKEKRPVGRPKEAVDQGDGSPQPPRMEPPGLGTMARTELLVPLPGPREPSPHPCMGLPSEGPWIQEERRVTRTVRTTTVVAGQVERRVKSSVAMNPVLPAEALSRGRNTVRKIRTVVVNPQAEGSPSRSQALELLTSLVPTERSPPASRLPRPTVAVPRSPGLGGTGGAVLGRLPETEASEPKDRSNLGPVGIPEGAHLPQYQLVPAAHPDQDQSRALESRTHEGFRVQEASSPLQLSPQTPQDPVPRPFCPRIEIHPPPLDPVQSPKQPVVPTHLRTQHHLKSMVPPDLPSLKKDLLPDTPSAPVVPEQILTSFSVNRKTASSSGCLPVPSSPSNRVIQDSEDTSVFSFTPKDLARGPSAYTDPPLIQKEAKPSPDALTASPTKSTMVVQDPEASPSSASTQKEAVQSAEGRLASFLTKKEIVQDLPDPASVPPKQAKTMLDPAASPLSSPTQNEAEDSAASAALLSTEEVAVQGPAVLPTSPSAVDKVSPSPEGPQSPVPLGAEDNLPSQLVPNSSKDKMPSEPSRDEDEMALTADLEIFLDTLRSMEPPEILRTHRLPRAPRSSYLAMYATLPAIEEDQPGPWVLGPRPHEVPALEKEEKEGKEEEEEEELENPYLSDDEKLQHRQEKAKSGPSWDPHPAKPPQDFCSPLEMMKKHVAGTKGSHSELGLDGQLGSRLTSRLGGSLLFGGLMLTTKETPTLEPLGTKLSALPPHRAPGLKKVLGQLPLLCSEKPAPERSSRAQRPEGWSPALKIQGKLNTRPGKIILFSEPSCQGRSKEVWEDTADTSDWGLVASVRVVRGSWVLYEEPEFRGQKLVLLEGDVELQGPGIVWSPQGIGSLRKAVQHYSTPEISLFSEEDLKGEQLKLTQALEDPQSLGTPLQVASITVSAGLWLLYSKPFFEDTPCILEPGNYHNLEACGISDPVVGSLKPVTLGCPSVERPGEPKAVVYEAPDFQGRSWEVSRDIYNLQQPEDSQSPNLASVGSLRVLGGCWVGYEKEGFRGHQYLLEEGEYADWSHWGGYDEVLTSLRVIRTDFGDPALVLFEAMDFEGPGVEVSEALSDVELAGHGPSTQAINVLSGVWVAYQEVGFSGEQYVLEKGVYRNCDDWGLGNSALASLQPVLQVGEHNLHFVSKIQLFSSPNFLGDHISFEDDQASLPLSFQPQSCRVHGGSWILFDEKNFEGDQHILSEGEFPTLTAMGCLASTVLGSLQKVPLHFSEPSIFLYGLECFEGKEIELNGEVRSLQAEGFNNHVLSVRIKGGIWVLCEHSDFRGRQWLVGSCEITNWLTYSGTQRVGSLYPIKQRRAYFRLWNAALGGFLAVPDHVEDMKAGRVVVSDPRAGGSCVWYYEDGLLKNQVAPTMSLQVIGSPSKGSKVVLWAESRLPRQTWSIKESGHIYSQMFEDRILDVKGGRGYDRDHVVLWELARDRPSQIWTIHVL